ncbi:phage tail assembly chaperone [Arenicella sp.]|nr:phage tail assembly chaperone [Arenicella sp.]
MNKYTKYDENTGEILLNFITSEKDLSLNKPFVEGWFAKDDYVIVNGVAQKTDKIALEETEEYAIAMLRLERGDLLQKSDWTQVPDAPVDQAAWATYRQALRDLPQNTEDPSAPLWPTKPE